MQEKRQGLSFLYKTFGMQINQGEFMGLGLMKWSDKKKKENSAYVWEERKIRGFFFNHETFTREDKFKVFSTKRNSATTMESSFCVWCESQVSHKLEKWCN